MSGLLGGISTALGAAGAARTQPSGGTGATDAAGQPLSREQQAEVQRLKKRDAEVKAHEQAHAAVGGAYAGPPKYTYTRGPDGKRYATGGEVEIDTSPERTPEQTIRKMDVVIRAALAPAEPSSQDRAVARQAQQIRIQAQQQLAEQQAAERNAQGAEGGEAQPGSLSALLSLQETGETAAAASDKASGIPNAQVAAASAAYTAAAELFGG